MARATGSRGSFLHLLEGFHPGTVPMWAIRLVMPSLSASEASAGQPSWSWLVEEWGRVWQGFHGSARGWRWNGFLHPLVLLGLGGLSLQTLASADIYAFVSNTACSDICDWWHVTHLFGL